MNVLTNLDRWRIVDGVDGKYIMADTLLKDKKVVLLYERILRIDFENRLVETVNGYYKLGDEHR